MKRAENSEKLKVHQGSPSSSPAGDGAFTLPMGAFARRHERGKSTATKWKGQGLLVLDAHGRVKVAESEAKLAAAGRIKAPADTSAGDPAPGDDAPAQSLDPETSSDPTLDALSQRLAAGDMLTTPEAEQVKQNYLARLRQLEWAAKAEQVVDVDVVVREVGRRLQHVRSRLLSLPQSAAPHLAHQDAGIVADRLLEEVTKVLEELSGQHADDGRDVAEEALRNGR